MKLVLASESPRRQEILSWLGLPYEVQPSETAESLLPGELPHRVAWRIALEKATTVGQTREPGTLVLAADTIVVLDGAILGKPEDADEARGMLRELRGREHVVITGVALQRAGQPVEPTPTASTTTVRMRSYSDQEIDRYVASGDPMDKAGAYAIQHVDFAPVAAIKGCYLNVVGLPLCLVGGLLHRYGVSNRGDKICRDVVGHDVAAPRRHPDGDPGRGK
ncbi:MAG: septum formation protein Maf [Chloroflexi bacterium]|nr:septum formation protein Maf [Chloroflexota bacterium]